MQFLRLAWLLLPILQAEGQLLSSPDGVCKEGWECRKERHCPQYLDQKDRLKRLEGAWAWGGGGGHKKKLADELAELVCNKEEGGVCCKEQFEIVNGNVVERVEQMPYIVRLYLTTGFAQHSICGASLISSRFLLSAKHCFDKFDWCIKPTDCVAHFRDLKAGRGNHERGEFFIPITDFFEKEGASDLAVVMLKHKVEEHPDYNLGVPLQPIKLAREDPKPGEEVITGGWGLTGYNEQPSDELRSLSLTITEVRIFFSHSHGWKS